MSYLRIGSCTVEIKDGMTKEQIAAATKRLLQSLEPKKPVGDVRTRTMLTPQSIYRKLKKPYNFTK